MVTLYLTLNVYVVKNDNLVYSFTWLKPRRSIY